MVGVLWEAGRFAAAIRLEEFWNALLRDGGFRLFCAYPIDVCGDGFHARPTSMPCMSYAHARRAERLRSSRPRSTARCTTCSARRASALRPLMDAETGPSWAALPRAEATILWLRDNVPSLSGAILTRTREYAHLARYLAPH